MPSEPAIKKGGHRYLSVGKYQVLKHIATGGMGAVYRARDQETDREVALKVLSPELVVKPLVVERFRREAKLGQKLRHGLRTHDEFVAHERPPTKECTRPTRR